MTTRFHISVRRILAICVMAVGTFVAKAEEVVLWWQVPDDATVATFHQGDVSASSLGVKEARIRASNGEYLVIPIEFDGQAVEGDSYMVPMQAGAWFAVLPSNPGSLSFMVELGNWDDATDSWVGLAQSKSYTYDQLKDHIISNWSGPSEKPSLDPWVADGYVVPEPSSGILLLIGGGLLALRRKRRG